MSYSEGTGWGGGGGGSTAMGPYYKYSLPHIGQLF